MLLASALLALLILTGAVWVVTLRNLFRAALSLGLVLLGVAGLFLLLEAEFLAFAQILVYVGMLTAKLQGSAAPASRQQIPAAAVSVGLFAALASATQPLVWPAAGSSAAVSLVALGQQLVTTLVLPFEVISLVFVAAAVGAIALAASGQSEDRQH